MKHDTGILQHFPDDVRDWIEASAKTEDTTPVVFIREQMRALAENDRRERDRA